MIKTLREQIWFISGFLKKYFLQVIISVVFTIVFALLARFFISRLPSSKTHIRVGIVGQFSAGQIPVSIINLINSGLVRVNEKFEPVPNLAKSWQVDTDGKTYTFDLNDGLAWNGGGDVKASDIKISIPNITIETQDPNIIKFKIPSKFSPFPSLLNIPILNNQGKTIGEFDIKLKQKTSGVITQIILESANKAIIFNVYPTPKQALTAYKLGQLDLVIDLPNQMLKEAEAYGKIHKYVDQSQVVMMIFNQSDPTLKDKNTRQGIAYALQDKTFGEDEAITTINTNSWAYNPLVKTYPYNQNRLKELITVPITLEIATTPELLPIADKIKSQLDSDKIKINTKVVTSTPDQYQIFLTTYNIPADPDQYRDWHSTQATNIGRGSDEKIDKMLEDGRVTQEQKERRKIYFEFQKTFSEEIPALVLYHPSVFDIGRAEKYFGLFQN